MEEDIANRSRLLVAELSATLNRELSESLKNATNKTLALRYLAMNAFEAVCGAFQDAPADEIESHAISLRGLVLQGTCLLTEIQSEAGRIETLSEFRRVTQQYGVDGPPEASG